MNNIKEFWTNLGAKTKKMMIICGVAVVAIAAIAALALNHKEYGVLFASVNAEEAQQIIGKLQESGVEYQYKNNGDILVPVGNLEKTKASLLYEGYPKSGFTYDVFRENSGMMTTETDKDTYKLYDLQNRIGAQICIFDGVKDAKVTIALGQSSKYALNLDEPEPSSASVVVTMKDNGSPSEEMAAAIQRLVSKAVYGMEIDNVAVFDGNGNDVTVASNSEKSTSREGTEISQLIEGQLEEKILNLLEPVYGRNNVRVAVRGKVNMEKLLRESVQYTTPEKVNEEDKAGIVQREDWLQERADGTTGGGGVAGVDGNADVPAYGANAGTTANGYGSSTMSREFLINEIREQGQIDPGVLEDTTVAITINGEDFGALSQAEIQDLVGNAAGIVAAERAEKITVVSAPFYKLPVENMGTGQTPGGVQEVGSGDVTPKTPPMLLVIVGVAIFVFLLLLIIVFLLLRRKKKKKAAAAQAALAMIPAAMKEGVAKGESGEDEVIDIQNERGVKLRDSIREFSDQNPEIAASLIKNWLNGGEKNEY